jgi:NADH:ubiquinone oxidoreductase subunit E
MSEYQKKMLAALKRVQKTFQEMSDEELDRRFNESKVTEEQVKQYAVLERMILAEGRKD